MPLSDKLKLLFTGRKTTQKTELPMTWQEIINLQKSHVVNQFVKHGTTECGNLYPFNQTIQGIMRSDQIFAHQIANRVKSMNLKQQDATGQNFFDALHKTVLISQYTNLLEWLKLTVEAIYQADHHIQKKAEHDQIFQQAVSQKQNEILVR